MIGLFRIWPHYAGIGWCQVVRIRFFSLCGLVPTVVWCGICSGGVLSGCRVTKKELLLVLSGVTRDQMRWQMVSRSEGCKASCPHAGGTGTWFWGLRASCRGKKLQRCRLLVVWYWNGVLDWNYFSRQEATALLLPGALWGFALGGLRRIFWNLIVRNCMSQNFGRQGRRQTVDCGHCCQSHTGLGVRVQIWSRLW